MFSKDIEGKFIEERLIIPTGKLRVVIDTDAYNEVDDQFAIAWALRDTERFDVEAVYAAPYDRRAIGVMEEGESAKNGMERSYDEIINLYNLLGISDTSNVYRGSESFMTAEKIPVPSDACEDLIKRAHQSDEVLYVIALGAATNLASALIKDPSIISKIVIVWLGGQPTTYSHATEFNLMQDVYSAQVLFDSKVPLVYIPCMQVASLLSISAEELCANLKGKSKVGSYLTDIVVNEFKNIEYARASLAFFSKGYLKGQGDYPSEEYDKFETNFVAWSRIIWDISVVGFLKNPTWCVTKLEPSPILKENCDWDSTDESRHPIRVCNYLFRDHMFGEMFSKLNKD